MARKNRRHLKGGADKGGAGSRWRVIGFFAGELLVDAILYLLLLLFTGLTSFVTGLLPRFTSNREFLVFAAKLHLVLLWVDGFLFVWAVLYLVARGIKEYLR